jgi:hypothetical protein
VCFRRGVGPRWFVRCRCGRHANCKISTNIGRSNVYTRWFCARHHEAFEHAERLAGRR